MPAPDKYQTNICCFVFKASLILKLTLGIQADCVVLASREANPGGRGILEGCEFYGSKAGGGAWGPYRENNKVRAPKVTLRTPQGTIIGYWTILSHEHPALEHITQISMLI